MAAVLRAQRSLPTYIFLCTIEAALKLDAIRDDVFELARASYQTSAGAYVASGPAIAATKLTRSARAVV